MKNLINSLLTLSIMMVIMVALVVKTAETAEYDVIKKPSPVNNEMSIGEVRKLFSLKTPRWDDDTPITIYILPFQNRHHKAFVRKVLRSTPKRFKSMVEEHRNGRGGVKLEKARGLNDMLDRVSNTDGGVGYSDHFLVMQQGAGYVQVINIR